MIPSNYTVEEAHDAIRIIVADVICELGTAVHHSNQALEGEGIGAKNDDDYEAIEHCAAEAIHKLGDLLTVAQTMLSKESTR